MGLGRYPVVYVRKARDLAFEARKLIESGKDPIGERARQLAAEKTKFSMATFAEAAQSVHASLKEGFRNSKYSEQWLNTLKQYIFPSIGNLQVSHLAAAVFARALQPIWLQKPETASRVKQRYDAVMKWCAANGFITASPVSVVVQLMPKQPGKRERVAHQPAVPWREVPIFVRDVLHAGLQTQSKLMLEVLILTAARSGEIRQMEWTELDFEKRHLDAACPAHEGKGHAPRAPITLPP